MDWATKTHGGKSSVMALLLVICLTVTHSMPFLTLCFSYAFVFSPCKINNIIYSLILSFHFCCFLNHHPLGIHLASIAILLQFKSQFFMLTISHWSHSCAFSLYPLCLLSRKQKLNATGPKWPSLILATPHVIIIHSFSFPTIEGR